MSLKKRIEAIEARISPKNHHRHVYVDTNTYQVTIVPENKNISPKIYIPSVTGYELHSNVGPKAKLVMGPYRSGKSTMFCMDIIIDTVLRMPPMTDGVKRARWAIVRSTMGQLETTTLKTWMNWCRHLGTIERSKKPIYCLTHKFFDGTYVTELEIMFLALDREEDREKLASFEPSGIYFNEMQHINSTIFVDGTGRVSMYPPLDDLTGEYQGYVGGDTNPPDDQHWIYKKFEEANNKKLKIFHQPPGLIYENDDWKNNPDRENKDHIIPNYYMDLAESSNWDKEYIKVYCCGEYGLVKSGKVVFHEYNDNIHALEEVRILDNGEVYVFWDYGLTPCALICQMTHNGQLRAVKEFVSERSGVKQLATLFVKPYLVKNFPNCEIISRGDPSNAAAQTDANNCENILSELGIPTQGQKLDHITNNIDSRLNAGRDFLNRLIDGSPAFVLSKKECKTLRKALKKEYCYKRIRVIGDEKYEEKPNKTHPWSDIADCFEYACLEFTFKLKNDTQNDFDYKKFHQYSRF
jgi:hypothetical protein